MNTKCCALRADLSGKNNLEEVYNEKPLPCLARSGALWFALTLGSTITTQELVSIERRTYFVNWPRYGGLRPTQRLGREVVRLVFMGVRLELTPHLIALLSDEDQARYGDICYKTRFIAKDASDTVKTETNSVRSESSSLIACIGWRSLSGTKDRPGQTIAPSLRRLQSWIQQESL